jgi:hypothetical protein
MELVHHRRFGRRRNNRIRARSLAYPGTRLGRKQRVGRSISRCRPYNFSGIKNRSGSPGTFDKPKSILRPMDISCFKSQNHIHERKNCHNVRWYLHGRSSRQHHCSYRQGHITSEITIVTWLGRAFHYTVVVAAVPMGVHDDAAGGSPLVPRTTSFVPFLLITYATELRSLLPVLR